MTSSVQPHTKSLLYPTANQVSYTHLGQSFQAFLSSLGNWQDPLQFEDAIIDKKWSDALNIEL